MTPADARRFGDLWQVSAERTGNRPRSDAAVMADFEDLAAFELFEIEAAVRAHCRRPGEQWMPKVGDIVALIEGALPSNDALVALAHDARTPLGKFLSVRMGTDLQRLHPKDLVVRAGVYRSEIEDFHRRALVGEYTEAELRMLVGAGIDPAGELGPETAGPRAPFKAGVERRAQAARSVQIAAPRHAPPRHRSERAVQSAAENMAKMRSLFGALDLSPDTPSRIEDQCMESRLRAREYRERGEALFAQRVEQVAESEVES